MRERFEFHCPSHLHNTSKVHCLSCVAINANTKKMEQRKTSVSLKQSAPNWATSWENASNSIVTYLHKTFKFHCLSSFATNVRKKIINSSLWCQIKANQRNNCKGGGEATKAAINRKQAALVLPNKQTNKLGRSPTMAVEAVNQTQ